MLRKKTFKILSVFVAIIIVASLLCIPASALDLNSLDYTFEIQPPVANSNSGYIEMITENWGPVLIYFNASFQSNTKDVNINDGAFNFYASITSDDTLQIRNQGLTKYTFPDGSTAPLYIYGFYLRPQGWTNWLTSSYGSASGVWTPMSLWLGNTGDILYARGYNINLNSLGVESEFPAFIYGSDGKLFNELNAMKDLLRSNSSGFQSVIDNANKNASQIQANQDKNTNKVINGGTDNPHFSSVDNSATDDYKSKEDEVNNKTASARSSTVSFFNNFGALLNDTPVQRGLLAVSKIMTEIFSIGWLAGIINFALAIGAFAFILGSVIMVVGKISSNESRSTRSEYYKSKTAYYNSRRKK